MKKILSVSMLACAVTAFAQDTYMNEQLLNNSEDVIGTARYVGMAGAMGALGADMSVIGWNPAGIGLFRKSDASLSFGGLWTKSSIERENRGAGTFDQVGFVYNVRTGSDVCPYVNFAINYQKKKNFLSNFYADNPDLQGISQMDQLAELVNNGFSYSKNLAGLALNNNAFTPKAGTTDKYYNQFNGENNEYTQHSEGSLHGWDFNVSTNINDRAFLGFTFGVDNLNYDSWTTYFEQSSYTDNTGTKYGDYSIWNDYHITGYGFNFKLGGIVRPLEESSFRLGFAIESPTWYKLKSSVLMDYTDEISGDRSSQVESYIDFNPRTPWKFRASMGSTVSNKFAWDIDYEFADYKTMVQRYPEYFNSYGGVKDLDMKEHTRANLKAVHTLRAGMEYRPVPALAFRLGYNFSASAYDKDAHFDQLEIAPGRAFNSAALDYITRTSFMVTKPTHILALGMGYKWKHFYFDLAYKIRHQKADFFAFDDSFTAPGTEFSQANPELEGTYLNPVPVDLTRHNITCTLGFKF